MALGSLRRNLAFAPRQTKAVAYKTLVRPQLEYASPVWHPMLKLSFSRLRSRERLFDGPFGDGGLEVAKAICLFS